MGCALSQTKRPVNVRISILDSEFLRKENNRVREKMDKLRINYQTYVSLEKMLGHMLSEYRNVVVTTEQFLAELEKELSKVKLYPNIFVRSNNIKLLNNKHNTNHFNVRYFNSYQQLISQLSNRTSAIETNHNEQRNDSHVTLKILRQLSVSTEMQLEMIMEALKANNISFQIYHRFIDFQKSVLTKTCDFIICDYQYHRQVLNTVPDPYQTRIICVCAFTKKQTYDKRIYFMTENCKEIVNDIVIEQKWSHLNFVKCSRVFMYASDEKTFAPYAQVIGTMGFDVRIYSDLGRIVSESKYYFAISIIVKAEDQEQVESYLQTHGFWFKTKLIRIQKQAQNTIKSLQKVVKQLKRGYRGQKSTTRSIDIIDKQIANNTKHSVIREELAKHKVLCCMYSNIDEYISSLKYISPYVIVNQEESALLLRYLREVRASGKVVLFCHRNNAQGEVKNENAFCFVSDHLGKIVNYVTSNVVYNPVIPDPKRLQFKNEDDDFDRVDPSEIQQEDADLQSYRVTKYTTANFNKSRR